MAEAIRKHVGRVVALRAAVSSDRPALIASVRDAAPGVRVLAGGPIFEVAGDAWTALGADAYAAAADGAVAAAERLVS